MPPLIRLRCGALWPKTLSRFRRTWAFGLAGAVTDPLHVTWVRPRSASSTTSVRALSANVPEGAEADATRKRSPGLRLSPTPSRDADVDESAGCASVSEGANAFHSGRASTSSTVSNVCGCSPGPGMLWTRRPGSRVRVAGVTGGAEPGSFDAAAGTSGGGSSANARNVSAATPGRSR